MFYELLLKHWQFHVRNCLLFSIVCHQVKQILQGLKAKQDNWLLGLNCLSYICPAYTSSLRPHWFMVNARGYNAAVVELIGTFEFCQNNNKNIYYADIRPHYVSADDSN